MALAAHIDSLKSLCGNGEVRAAFIRGVIVTLIIYALIFAVLFLRSDSILKNTQDKLATKTVLIESAAPIKVVNEESFSDEDEPQAEAILPVELGFGEKTALGVLPIITPEGKSYFSEFKKDTLIAEDAKTVSVIITNLASLGDKEKRDIAELNENIAYSISPYLKDSASLHSYLSAEDRELWLSLPIERASDGGTITDPGPKALLSRLSYANNKDNLNWIMAQGHSYTGLAAFSNSAFTKNQPVMRLILKDVFARGLGLVDLNPDGLDYFEQNAAFNNAPYLRGSVNLSKPEWRDNIKGGLERAEKLALMQGKALIVVPYYPNVIKELKQWLPRLSNSDIRVVPPSSVAAMGISSDILFKSPE